ncbi:YqaJ viral recombinase family protein [Methylophilales phage MEP301]|nr:YqaJ viral recombinase family protein [Methylophilales phage MEP301]
MNDKKNATVQGQQTPNIAEGKLTRDDILSGSQVAAAMGRNPYQTPNDPLKHAFNAVKGLEREPLSFEALHWGTQLEVPIIEEAVQRLGLKNTVTNFGKAFYHKDVPLGVSLDATAEASGQIITVDPDKGIFVVDDDEIVLEGLGIIEAKLTSQEKEIELPDYRGRIQLQAQMDVVQSETGVPVNWGIVCVLYRGITLRMFVFKRNEALIQEIKDCAIDFDRRVQKYRDNEETEWYEFTKVSDATSIYDQASDETLLDDSLASDVGSIDLMYKLIDETKEKIESTQAKIMAEMRDHKHLIAGPYRVTWGELNYKATPEKIVPAKPARTIRVSKLKIKPL